MSGLTLNPGSNTVQSDSTPVLQNWSFEPPSADVVYYQGDDMPEAFDIATQFKDMMNIPSTQGMSNFQYRLYAGIPAGLFGSHLILAGDTIQPTGTVWHPYTNGMSGNITYNFIGLSSIPAGIYTFPIYHQIRANMSFGVPQIIAQYIIYITLTVYPSSVPVITTSQGLAFQRTIGDNADVLKPIQVAGALWKLKVPNGFFFTPVEGVTLEPTDDGGYTATGAGTKAFQIGCTEAVEPNVIIQNPLQFSIDVNEGLQSLPMTVTFIDDSGLFLSTESLHFVAYKGIQDAGPQYANIEYSGGNFYLQLPPFMTYGSFYTFFIFNVLSADNMAAGQYTGQIKVRDQATNEVLGVINVVYDVVDAIQSPYPNEYGFTLDNNFITVLSQSDNTYYDITVNARIYKYYSTQYTDKQFSLKAVLFRRSQKFNLGKSIDKLMEKLPHFEGAGSVNPYRPAEVTLQLTERSYTDPDYIQEYQLPTVKFYAGLTPPLFAGTGILDMNLKPARITPTGYTYLNLLVNFVQWGGYPVLKVFRHRGGAIEQVQNTGLAQGLHSIKVDASQFDAVQGDMYEYRLTNSNGLSRSKYYKVFPEGKESNHIVWENEYKLKSALEFTGDYKIKSDFENRNQSLVQNLVDLLEKIENTKATRLTINTGWVLKDDMYLIENLHRAKRAALINGGEIINLVPLSKTIINADNTQELYDYDVEFEINREYNEKIYTL